MITFGERHTGTTVTGRNSRNSTNTRLWGYNSFMCYLPTVTRHDLTTYLFHQVNCSSKSICFCCRTVSGGTFADQRRLDTYRIEWRKLNLPIPGLGSGRLLCRNVLALVGGMGGMGGCAYGHPGVHGVGQDVEERLDLLLGDLGFEDVVFCHCVDW